MQNIHTQIIDQDKKVVSEPGVDFADVLGVLYKIENYQTQYPLLASIDPYDDTTFTRFQLKTITEELQMINEKQNNAIVSAAIEAIDAVKDLEYLHLIGD